jgi:hypothetical protein
MEFIQSTLSDNEAQSLEVLVSQEIENIHRAVAVKTRFVFSFFLSF